MAKDLSAGIEEIRELLKEREGADGDLAGALKKTRRRLPRRIFKQGMVLARALPLLEHPKLRLTVDEATLLGAQREVAAHLKSVDLAERRKDRILNVLASMAFALITVATLLIVVLRWRGFI